MLKSVYGSYLRSNIEVIKASSPVLHIQHNSYPYQKSWWKVQANLVTPQELKMVCAESNEINGEKIVLFAH